MDNNASKSSSSSSSSHSPMKFDTFPIQDFYDLPAREGNIKYGFRMRLYCRTGYNMAILSDGKVKGIDDNADEHSILVFSSAGSPGEVRIQAEKTNLYLAMNKESRIYGELDKDKEETIFVEMVIGQYTAYLSRKFAHKGWYMGIKKNGKHKPGNKTRWGQKSIQFLKNRIET